MYDFDNLCLEIDLLYVRSSNNNFNNLCIELIFWVYLMIEYSNRDYFHLCILKIIVIP